MATPGEGSKGDAGPQAARVGVRGPCSRQAQPWTQLLPRLPGLPGGGDAAFPEQSSHLKQSPGLPLSLSLSLSPILFWARQQGSPSPGSCSSSSGAGRGGLQINLAPAGRLASPPFALGNNEPAPAHLPAAEGHPRPAAPPRWGQTSPPGQRTRPGRLPPRGGGRRQPGPTCSWGSVHAPRLLPP